MKLYPLQFKPILKPKIWGGDKLSKLLAKESSTEAVGESWEISAVPGSLSVLDNGPLKGRNIVELMKEYGADLVGADNVIENKPEFPLLFKFIDAKENLSLQVHPNDELAKKRHNSLGKTEMWYILEADEGAGIYVGFKPGVQKEEYTSYLEKGKLQDIMNFIPVKTGDTFFIKAGLVHAIGEGVLLAEIQQSSDITYRVFDWNRTDAEGNSRELHTEEAKDAIDFDFTDYQVDYDYDLKDQFLTLVKGEYFHCKQLYLTNTLEVDYNNASSFVVLMCVDGEVEVKTAEGDLKVSKGSSLLLPATTSRVELKTEKEARLLQVTV